MKRRTLLAGLAGLAAAAVLPNTTAAGVPSSVLGQQMNLSLSRLASRTHFQGTAWAKSPVTGREYVFQLQAQATSKGDIEDLWVHRYELKSGALVFVDTMVGKGWGHCQTVKVRISAADNPYLLLGWEVYDPAGTQVGQRVYRVRYRGGVTTDRRYADATRVWLPGSYVTPLDCPDWTVAVRRSMGEQEVISWYDEASLLAATATAPATPRHSVTLTKAPDFQGMCVTGTWDRPDDVWRLNGQTVAAGATLVPATLWRFPADGVTPAQTLDVSNIINGNSDPEEAESVLRIGSELWVGKQTSPSSRRILALRKVGTIG